ncbi:MAG: hypothetical protein H6851_19515 [Geminicoccaceae bacterium]|nr:hypothetical protein [Geminicoccaceae bacterium]
MIAKASLYLAAVAALVLAGCTFEGPSLAGVPGLQIRVLNYYRDHAAEDNGRCLAPRIRAITRTEVLEQGEDRIVLRLRYAYYDREFGAQDDLDVMVGRCNDFATRDFTIEKNANGVMVVTGMTGETHTMKNWSR